MAKLKSKINRFFYNNRNKGIPNLMLFIAGGNVIAYLLFLLNVGNEIFTNALYFDSELILKGQIWRLFTHVFLYLRAGNGTFVFLRVISLAFYYWAGKVLEQYWGVLRFNCYYFLGVLLTDLVGLAIGASSLTVVEPVNLSLFLALATVAPDERILIWFILPVKLKWMAWVYFAFLLKDLAEGILTMIYLLTHGAGLYLDWVLQFVALANYFLFFGSGIKNVMPDFIRYRRKKPRAAPKKATVFHTAAQGNYRFKCTVCGRTELSDPKLEFRYCSKCSGYRCYCQDHINNHAHITNISEQP